MTLFAHADSDTAGRLVPYGGTRAGHPVDVARNTLSIARLALQRPDVIHSFGRLMTLGPLLPTTIPKVMTYQRQPTLRQVARAARLARGTLAFTGCAEHIAAQTRPYAPSYAVFNGVPMDHLHVPAPRRRRRPRSCSSAGSNGSRGRTRPSRSRARRGGGSSSRGTSRTRRTSSARCGPASTTGSPTSARSTTAQKNELLGGAAAFLMPIEWEEPFGIVMAEALALRDARRRDAPGLGARGRRRRRDGGSSAATRPGTSPTPWAVVGALDRAACRADCEARFSDRAVVEGYLDVYRERIAAAGHPAPAA